MMFCMSVKATTTHFILEGETNWSSPSWHLNLLPTCINADKCFTHHAQTTQDRDETFMYIFSNGTVTTSKRLGMGIVSRSTGLVSIKI